MSLTGKHPIGVASLVTSLCVNRHLILQMVKREVMGRYKGSVMGLAWSFFNPIFMLLVYTFVFSVVFQSKWGDLTQQTESKSQFAMVLFAGLILYNFFAEVINRAPTLVVSNTSYVKKVVFPLEVLPIVVALAALFHALVSTIVLLAAFGWINGYIPWTAVFFPVIVVPLIIVTLGLSWMLASLGVFLRDVGQTVAILTSVLLFLSPIFFPISALPEAYQPFMLANPLTYLIEQAREVLIWGRLPDWSGLLKYTVVALGVAWVGYAWFQKTRKGFADVL